MKKMKKMKKILSVLILFLFVSSCGMQGGLQRNRPASGLEWNSKNSNSQDENIAENIDLVKEKKVDVNAKKISSNSKVTNYNKIHNGDLASNSKNLSDLESEISSNSNTSFSVIDKLNYTNLSPKNKINKEEKNMKEKRKEIKKALKDDVPVGLLYVLCFFIPWVAVGLATNWDIETVVYNILLSLLFVIPGIIHAFIVVRNNS